MSGLVQPPAAPASILAAARNRTRGASALRDAWVDLLTRLEWAVAVRQPDGEWQLNSTAEADIRARGLPSQFPPDWEQPLRQTGDLSLAESGLTVWQPLVRPETERPTAPGLTPREREVWHWLRAGKKPDEISRILGCAVRTLQKHQQNLYRKLGVRRAEQAVNHPAS